MLINYVKENQSSILADYKKTVYSFKNLETFMSIYFKGVKYDNCPQRDNIVDNLYEYTRNRKQYIYNDISKGIINTKEDDIHTHQYLDFTTTEEDNKKFSESLSKGYEKYQPYGYDEAHSHSIDIGSQPSGDYNIGVDNYEISVGSDQKEVIKKVSISSNVESTLGNSYFGSSGLTWMDSVDRDLEMKKASIAQKLQDAALQASMENSAKNVKARRSSQQFRTPYNPNIDMSSEQAKTFSDAAERIFYDPTQFKVVESKSESDYEN